MAFNAIEDENMNAMKDRYNKNMSEYYSKETFSGPWTREWLKDIKIMLKSVDTLPLARLDQFHKFVQDKYIVKNKKGGQLLRVIKTFEGDDVGILAVPWEDAFDIIWKTHLECEHGSVCKTMNLLRTQYFIDSVCVHNVIMLCPKCVKNNESSSDLNLEPVYNKIASLEIFDMYIYIPDRKYKYILIYTDEGTGLVQLRALKGLNDLEIALKLIKIFTDLGPPKILRASGPHDYDGVIEIVNTIFQPCEITLDLITFFKSKAEYVQNLILEWLKNEKSPHWEIACYPVQWKINNIKNAEKIPYELVFRHNNLSRPLASDDENVKSRSSNTTNLQSQSPIYPHVQLFEEPEMFVPVSNVRNAGPEFTNLFDSEFIKQEGTDYQDDNVGSGDTFKGKNLELCKSAGTKKRAYVNKKGVNTVRNIIVEHTIEKEPEPFVKIEPPEDSSSIIQDDFGLSNINTNLNNAMSIEFQKMPIKIDASNSGNICSECNTEISAKSYTCMKCMKDIHLECGEKVVGVAEEQIVCSSCEKEVKKSKK